MAFLAPLAGAAGAGAGAALLQAEPLLRVYPQAQSLVQARLVQESLVVLA